MSMTLYHPDYVCVLDIDLLELAITTWKGSDKGKLVSAPCLFTYLRFIYNSLSNHQVLERKIVSPCQGKM